MSLLLEALKKAELAKQGAKPAEEAPPPALQIESLSLEPQLGIEANVPPVITREELPDISQPLEILTEDLPSARAPRAPDVRHAAASPTVPVSEPGASVRPATVERGTVPSAVASPPAEGRAVEEENVSARDAARQLFEAKEVEYNPRRPFYITVAVLVLAGSGYGGYVWWELQPKYPAVNSAALKGGPKGAPPGQTSGPVGQMAQAPAQEAAPPAPVPGTEPARSSPGTVQATVTAPAPAGKAAKDLAPVPAVPSAQASPTGPVFTRGGSAASAPPTAPVVPRPAATARARPGEAAARAPIAITPPSLAVDPVIDRAFNAYQRGDLALARESYLSVLQRETGHRDALLGLAAIDIRARNFDLAEARYLKLLEVDPRDLDAHAGLLSLRGHLDPVQSESRLKTLIASSPEASHLHFILGNQYAIQSRWPEAQASYFKAYNADPENPDFAFNLAVSLDQLHQPRVALQYYVRALALAAHRPGNFDQVSLNARIQDLQRR